jgi:O-methyltransferase involved in polyketide biosynthesis
MYGLPGIHRRLVVADGLWHFGLMPEQVEAFLGEYGWRLVEHLGTSELLTRYVGPARPRRDGDRAHRARREVVGGR